jgi:hypothetical protein
VNPGNRLDIDQPLWDSIVTLNVTRGNHNILARIECDKLQFDAFCRENMMRSLFVGAAVP